MIMLPIYYQRLPTLTGFLARPAKTLGGFGLVPSALPILTGFLAWPAKTLGGFGLVGGGITIPYHVSILGRTLPRVAFTNHYHREEDITHSGRDHVLCGVITD